MTRSRRSSSLRALPGTSARLGVAVALLGGLLLLTPQPASADGVVTLVADGYVDASAPDSSYGKRSYLRVDDSPSRVAYLMFELSGVTDFSSATLRVHVETDSTSATGVQVRPVADTSWTEKDLTATSAPAYGDALDSSGPVTAGLSYDLDVSAAVRANGRLSLALTTPASTAIRISSREGGHPAQLLLPAPELPDRYVVSALDRGGYQAVPDGAGTTYTGSVKHVVESAILDLGRDGDGGTISFAAGTFDLGSEYLRLRALRAVVFEGAGMDATIIRNHSDAAADTEPFNFAGADGVTIRDLQVVAGGAPRSTSDAIDLDQGNNSVLERVKVSGSRGRGIIFDGKNDAWTADGNVVRDCVVTGVPSRGIELLASSHNRIEGCLVTDTGGAGIHVNKASATADQANKKSSDNVIIGNTVLRAGGDGISVNSGDRNQVLDNVVLNSSTVTSGRDGIRIGSSDSVDAVDNRVAGNTASDDRTPKLQSYGLNIASSRCLGTVVGSNALTGNKNGPLRDLGTATSYT